MAGFAAQRVEADRRASAPGGTATRYTLTDDLWAAMEPPVRQAKRHRGGHPPAVPDRVFLEALLYVGRAGIPWRDLPAESGAWDAAYNRPRRWAASGGLRRLFEALTADPRFGDVRRVFVDGTVVRAHQHAAGAPRRRNSSGRPGRRPPGASAGAGAGGRPRSSSRPPTRTPPWRWTSSRGRPTRPPAYRGWSARRPSGWG